MASDPMTWSASEVLPILRKVSFFEGLPDQDLERVAEIVDGSTAEEGDVLFEEGDPGEAFYIVFDGSVEIVKAGSGGPEEKLAVRRSGEGFGEMALLNDAPRSATARATGATRLIVVQRDDFRDLLGGDSLAVRMMGSLSAALRALNVRFAAREAAEEETPPEDVSRLLQRGLMGRNAPKVEGYEIAAGTSLEDEGEGRTLWDSFLLADGRTALVSLYVRGDGLPPGYHLGVARALLRQIARHEERLTDLTRLANEGLADVAVEGSDQFVECGVLVASEDELLWTGAGRSPGAILRRDGNFEELPSHGPPLGMMGGFRYGVHRTEMGSGDVALVLSAASKGLFRGAADLVATVHGKPVGEVVSTVHRALRKAQEGPAPETTVLYVRKR